LNVHVTPYSFSIPKILRSTWPAYAHDGRRDRSRAQDAAAADGQDGGVRRRVAASLVAVLTGGALVGCTSDAVAPDAREPTPEGVAVPSPPPWVTAPPPVVRPDVLTPNDVRRQTAWDAVLYLARGIGPRHGTSREFRQAAGWVSDELRSMGYDVQRQVFQVPGGDSWGVPVPAGRSVNLVATRPGTRLDQPHLVVGAHLDTVPQAPGAEDNASGVGVLLGVAEAAAFRATRLPVVFVAFGAEEPRGPSDDDHHYGSRHYVASLSPAERGALRGMVSLDRVGVGPVLPVCSAGPPDAIRASLIAAAERADVAFLPCTGNRASDHWSFVRDGLPGARLGSTPYSGYHSPADIPSVIDLRQLDRAAWTVVAWLSPR
jgi:aminopeptidase YwaD